MQHIFVYGDSQSWGFIPLTRKRLPFEQRWPTVMETSLNTSGTQVRVTTDCLNGRRTVWEDPFKAGRNGLIGLAQRMEAQSPLDLVILMLGVNDFQSMHDYTAYHASQGILTLISAIRTAPLEPGMPVPPILVVAPPAIQTPQGPIAPKFAGGEKKCIGLAAAYRDVCEETGCHYFDAGQVITTSPLDGVHLGAEQHLALGKAMAGVVGPLLSAR